MGGHLEISQENMGQHACEKEEGHKPGLACLRQRFMGSGVREREGGMSQGQWE